MTDFLLLSADDDQLLQFLANHHVVTGSRWCEQCFESCRRDVGRKLSSASSVIRLSMHIVVVGRDVVGTAEVCSLTLGLLAYRQSEHDRYERRKQLGSRKLVKDMSTREHRMQMRKWKKWKSDSIRRHRENEQLPNVASTPVCVVSCDLPCDYLPCAASLAGIQPVRPRAQRTSP